MANCKNCGIQIDDQAQTCPSCGAVQNEAAYASPATQPANAAVDNGSFGWAVLGFFFPLVGLILFLVWKDSKPKSAKNSGIGALVGFILNIVLVALSTCVMGAAVLSYS